MFRLARRLSLFGVFRCDRKSLANAWIQRREREILFLIRQAQLRND